MFKKKIKTEKAILIEKKVITNSKKTNEATNIMRMRFGIYDSLNTNKKKKTTHYYYYFMTKRGRLMFKVDPQIYHNTKLDSLGILERTGTKFISFKYEKIATKADIKILDW